MSQSEDYLDGLLNSINKAKTDAIEVQEKAEKKQQQANESRKAVAYDEDFFTATGINVDEVQTKTSHPYLRKVGTSLLSSTREVQFLTTYILLSLISRCLLWMVTDFASSLKKMTP